MKLYFVRHGESEFNTKNIHQHCKVVLSKKGIEQADSVAKRFLKIHVDIIFSSDYIRTKQTASIIADRIHKKIIFTSVLREVKSPSEIEGMKYEDPRAIKIKETIKVNKYDKLFHYSDEENFYDRKVRAGKFIKFIKNQTYENILIISHGIFIRTVIGLLLFKDLFSYDIYERLNYFYLDNTGITECQLNGKQIELMTWNDHAHFG